MLFNEDNFSVVIKGIDRLRLNFQSLNNITLKSICGNSANINKSFKIIKDAKKLNPNLNICLNYVLTKYNKDSLFDVVKFALKNNLDVKILEYMAIDKKIYVDIKYAKDFLKSLNPIEQFKDYQDDDIYIYKKSTSRIRLCYSFCNGFRCKSCRECGEIRLTSSSTLKHCFYNKVKDLEIKNDLLKQDIKSIKNKIISIDKIKGKLI